jgi:hypothetical protein
VSKIVGKTPSTVSILMIPTLLENRKRDALAKQWPTGTAQNGNSNKKGS